jgi:hypothetical protein
LADELVELEGEGSSAVFADKLPATVKDLSQALRTHFWFYPKF